MSFSLPENFLFLPIAGTLGGRLVELAPAPVFAPNSFVLLPYSNPQLSPPQPRFYSLKNETLIEDLSLFKKETKQSIRLTATTSKQNYLKHVQELRQHIQLGNIYEINYCMEFFAEAVEIDPIDVFIKQHQLAKAPYAMLVKLGNDFISCASPELFLQKEGTKLFTKPIKGTIRRGQTAEEDEALKTALYENIKERTENVMAVDVARNDLSQLAKKGSVQVNKLYNIETFETVHQMVSTVSCELKENTSFEKIVRCTFPMASMTGAPKLRAMQLIDEHEDFTRGFYSGAMGLVDEKGDFTLAVIIRSIFYNRQTKRLSLAVGSAITYLSEPQQEYEECLLKANALIKALGATLEIDP